MRNDLKIDDEPVMESDPGLIELLYAEPVESRDCKSLGLTVEMPASITLLSSKPLTLAHQFSCSLYNRPDSDLWIHSAADEDK